MAGMIAFDYGVGDAYGLKLAKPPTPILSTNYFSRFSKRFNANKRKNFITHYATAPESRSFFLA